jgi:hypothetical protein
VFSTPPKEVLGAYSFRLHRAEFDRSRDQAAVRAANRLADLLLPSATKLADVTVMKQKEQWPSAHILIEDKGSGTSLIQELRHQQIAVISIHCKDDKAGCSRLKHGSRVDRCIFPSKRLGSRI